MKKMPGMIKNTVGVGDANQRYHNSAMFQIKRKKHNLDERIMTKKAKLN